MRKGEEKEFKIRFHRNFRVKNLADKMVKFIVKMNKK